MRTAIFKPTKEKYAIKTFNRLKMAGTCRLKGIMDEIDILRNINHKKIIKCYTYFKNLRHIHLVMDFGGSSNLKQYIDKRINEKRPFKKFEFMKIFRQILNAVSYLHNNSIAHLDIKAENITINERNLDIKLVDFGFAIKDKLFIKIYCGTPCYMGPEFYDESCKSDVRCSDIWALGVLLYFLVTFQFPFTGKNSRELLSSIKDNNWNEKPIKNTNSNLICLFKAIFKIKPEERPTTNTIIQSKYLSTY